MRIDIRYSIGAMVLVEIDSEFVKARITDASITLTKQPDTDLKVTVVYKAFVKDQGRTVFSTDPELDANFQLYKQCEAVLTDEQAKLTGAERDRLILWNMRIAKHNPKKELQAKDNSSQKQKN